MLILQQCFFFFSTIKYECLWVLGSFCLATGLTTLQKIPGLIHTFKVTGTGWYECMAPGLDNI